MKSTLIHLFVVLLGLAGPVGTAAAQAPPAGPPAVPMRLDSQLAHLNRPRLPDTMRVKFLVNISRLHMATSLDSARAYGEQAVAVARRAHYRRGQAHALGNLAAACFYAADYPAAQQTFEAALEAARRIRNDMLVGNAYLGLGNVAWALRNAAASHAYYEQARRAYAGAKPRLVAGELLVLHNRSNHYLESKQPALARPLLRQAQALLALAPDPRQAANLTLLLGNAQEQQHQPDSAAATWRQVVVLAQVAQQPQPEGSANLNLATLYQTRHQYPAALVHAQRAAVLFRSLGDPASLAEALRVQADVLSALHRPGAYDTLSRYAALRDTILSQERLDAVATAQARFDRAGQQARITLLEQKGRIMALEAERRATRTRLLATGGLLLAGLLLAGITLAYRRRQRRQEAQLRERLAADLHDDLGPLLTQLAVESSLLRENVYAPDQLLARLRHLGETSQQAAQHLGAVLRDLDTGPAAAAPAPLADLVNELREHAHEALSPHEMGLTLTLTDPALAGRMLPAATRHALALIFREALHNVVKHAAGATLVRATIGPENDGLLLTLQDDGQLGPAADPARPGGRGLRSMVARAEAVGGRLTAAPGPGGFAVRAWLPLV